MSKKLLNIFDLFSQYIQKHCIVRRYVHFKITLEHFTTTKLAFKFSNIVLLYNFKGENISNCV